MTTDPQTLLFVLIALLLGLTLHEFAHALVGHYLGDDTAHAQGRLTINPLAHIDPVLTLAMPMLSFMLAGVIIGAAKPVPFNPWMLRGGKWGAAAVAVAGPLTNLLIAVFFALWLRLAPSNVMVYEFVGIMIATNVSLFVFNMIPFPPLDGSRLLYAVAPEGLRDIMDRIERGGVMTILILFMVLFYFGFGHYLGYIVKAIVNLLVPAGPLP